MFGLRPRTEAADLLVPFMAGSPRVVPLALAELVRILETKDKTVGVSSLPGPTRALVEPLPMGGIIWAVRELQPPLHLVALRARHTVNTLVANETLEHLMPRLKRALPEGGGAAGAAAPAPA